MADMNRAFTQQVADKLLAINEQFARCQPDNRPTVLQVVQSMGEGCLQDDFANQDEVNGALKVLNWILELGLYNESGD